MSERLRDALLRIYDLTMADGVSSRLDIREAARAALAEPEPELARESVHGDRLREVAQVAQEELDLLRAGLRTRGTIAEAVLRETLSGIVDADHPGSEDGTGKWRCRCSAHVAALAALDAKLADVS